VLPAPAIVLRVVLGPFANVLLASQRAVPALAEEAGFEFQFPTIHRALEDLIDRDS
jgi:NAD dependent epimerase/dehydratase family enzyme